ncbi:MAG: aldehyde dehydrogenase [Nitrospirota bacterium]
MKEPAILETPSETIQTEKDNHKLELDIPTFTPLVNGEDLDIGKYEYFPYADKLITEPKVALRIIRQLKNGEIPSNYKDYIFARYCVGVEDTNANAIKAAYEAFQIFKNFSLKKRRKIMSDIHALLLENKEKLIELMIIEGHPRKVAEWEFSGMDKVCTKEALDLYLPHLLNKVAENGNESFYWTRRPDGVVCLNPPKNAPCSSSYIGVLAILAGNTIIIKPPYKNPLSTIYLWKEIIYKAMVENNVPLGSINIVLGNSIKIMEEWLVSKYTNDIIYIGDSKKGLEVGVRAYQMGKKPILELSGNDTVFIWKDAPLVESVKSLLDGFMGATQICMIPKKAMVHEDIFEDFKERFIEEVKKLKIGLPSDPETILTPISKILEFYDYLSDALQKGAKLICGGDRVNYKGLPSIEGEFITPTVISIEDDSKVKDMKLFNEEIYFPLIPLVKVSANTLDKKDDIIFKKMINLANSEKYGLRFSAWTNSNSYVKKFMNNLSKSGILRINSRHVNFSSYLATHGGLKLSGGPFGEMNYVWQKTSTLQGVSITNLKKKAEIKKGK